LLAVSEIKEYKIITSLAEYSGEIREKDYTHDGISCRWYDLDEVIATEEKLFVPNVKNLIPKALKLIKLNRI
jgi:hypothetical protein